MEYNYSYPGSKYISEKEDVAKLYDYFINVNMMAERFGDSNLTESQMYNDVYRKMCTSNKTRPSFEKKDKNPRNF